MSKRIPINRKTGKVCYEYEKKWISGYEVIVLTPTLKMSEEEAMQ